MRCTENSRILKYNFINIDVMSQNVRRAYKGGKRRQ